MVLLNNNWRQKSLYKLCTASILISLSIVFSRLLSIDLPIFRIGIGQVPLELAGFLLGPLYGGISAAAADLAGAYIKGIKIHYGFTLDVVLIAVSWGLFRLIFKEKAFKLPYIIGIQIFTSISFNLFLRSYWILSFASKSYWAIVAARAPGVLISAIVYISLIYVIVHRLRKTKLKIINLG